MPVYLGQTVKAIPMALLIDHVKVTNVQLVNLERKPDSTSAKVSITRGTVDVRNITNLPSKNSLIMNADAYIEDKAHFPLSLNFNYLRPQFSFDGSIEKFDLLDLNPLILAYTPAKIKKGTLGEIAFSGVAERISATGTMKFLYHDLEVDLEPHKKAKWKSSVVAFAASTALNSSNPASSKLPSRVVRFQIERDE